MTLKDFANVDSFYRDKKTVKEIEYKEYMSRIIKKLGLENIKPYLPFGIDALKEKYKIDKHFNTTPLRSWDVASGYWPAVNHKTKAEEYKCLNGGLACLLIRNGITCFSISECVSILKTAARMLCEMEM